MRQAGCDPRQAGAPAWLLGRRENDVDLLHHLCARDLNVLIDLGDDLGLLRRSGASEAQGRQGHCCQHVADSVGEGIGRKPGVLDDRFKAPAIELTLSELSFERVSVRAEFARVAAQIEDLTPKVLVVSGEVVDLRVCSLDELTEVGVLRDLSTDGPDQLLDALLLGPSASSTICPVSR